VFSGAYDRIRVEKTDQLTMATAVQQSEPPSPPIVWHRARFCSTGECVEVARDGDAIVIRDSRDPALHLRYTRQEWRAFVLGVKAGDFDGLAALEG
jgi:hypothetical protein